MLRADLDYAIWYNSINALTEGAGNPQVREGVLRVLSTIPEITVANATTGGQPTVDLGPGSGAESGQRPAGPGGDDQRQHRNADQLRVGNAGAKVLLLGYLPGLPGDAGRNQGWQVLTTPGTRQSGLSRI